MEQISLGVVVTFSSSIQSIHSLQDSVHPVIISCPWHLKTVVDVAHHISYTQTLNQSLEFRISYDHSTYLNRNRNMVCCFLYETLVPTQSNPIQSQSHFSNERETNVFSSQATNCKIISTMVFPNRSRLQSNSSGSGI